MGTIIEKKGDFEIQRDTGPCALGHQTAIYLYWDGEECRQWADTPEGQQAAIERREWMLQALDSTGKAPAKWWESNPTIVPDNWRDLI